MKKNKKKVIIIGGEGNGTVIASAVEDFIDKNGKWEILGYLNDFEKKGTIINNFPVLDKIGNIKKYNKKDCYFIYTLLSAKKAFERKEKLMKLGIETKKFITFIHPTAAVSRYSKLGYGVVIMPNVVISPDVSIGNHTHVYANSLIGHDAVVKDFCFIANCASVGSKVLLEEGVHVGSNSSIIEGVTIGRWSLIGLGAVVIRNVESQTKVVGNPAKPIGEINLENRIC